MTDDKRPKEDAAPRPGYIPRPPSQADIDLISSQQDLISDDWTGEPVTPQNKETPAGGTTESKPG